MGEDQGEAMKEESPEKGQKWRRKSDGSIVRIMGIVENYLMYRRAGCSPGLSLIKDFLRNFERANIWEKP